MADLDVERAPRRVHPVAWMALALALAAGLLLLFSGPGTRMGWWHFRTGFGMMKWAAYLGIAAAAVALAGVALSRRMGRAVAGVALVVALVVVYLPWSFRREATKYPGIHDITTDTEDPPGFVAVLAQREGAPNPAAYEGDSVAAIQREAYPDIGPVMMAMRPDSAFTLALRAARDMGWALVDQNRAQGRIEATATTPFFGFRDDVVIRVSSASGIARVDVRSVSRVGRGDVGANANRIRAYVRRLRAYDESPVQAR